MRALPLPLIDASGVLLACTASIRDPALTGRLTAAGLVIVLAEIDYRLRGPTMTLHEIAGSNGVGGVLSTDEMMRVYSGTFVRSVHTRSMYDALKAAPINDICPLCAQRTVSTLDHYLPQSIHANLIVVPINLVPACAECNKIKLNHQPRSETEQGFHPYFDNFDDARWLVAEVVEGAPAALRFAVATPPQWSPTKLARAQRHFTAFNLGPLYASHAGVELSNIRFSLQRLAERGTPEVIRAFLFERAESALHARINAWQAATYDALWRSDWFCAGGYSML